MEIKSNKDEGKFCPLFPGMYCDCTSCAWYISKKERCAIWVLANSK